MLIFLLRYQQLNCTVLKNPRKGLNKLQLSQYRMLGKYFWLLVAGYQVRGSVGGLSTFKSKSKGKQEAMETDKNN